MSLATRITALASRIGVEVKTKIDASHPGVAKAWVCFGYVYAQIVIRAAHNIASVTRTAAGRSHLGLENGHAARDIRELRDLLEAWRDARRTAWQTTVKVITTGILAALLVGAAIKLKLMGGAQ